MNRQVISQDIFMNAKKYDFFSYFRSLGFISTVRCGHCGRRETVIEAVVKTAKEAGVNAGMRHLWNQVFQ